MNQLQISIDQIKWAIDLNNYFHHTKLANLVYTNLESIIVSVDLVIKSATNITTVNLSLNILHKFYEFIIYFFQSVCYNFIFLYIILLSLYYFIFFKNFISQIDNNFIKDLTEIIYTKLQTDIETKLNRINDTLVDNEQNNIQRPENNHVVAVIYLNNLLC
jgi:hypothetical protein